MLTATGVEYAALGAAVKAAIEFQDQRDQNLARRIVAEYAEWQRRSHRRGATRRAGRRH